MHLFTRILWPDGVRAPYLRLAVAMVAAPALLTGLLAIVAFLVGGVSEPDRAAVIAYTVSTSTYLAAALAGFTLTLGIVGIALLWALGQRGILSWAGMGAALGAAAGLMVGVAAPGAQVTVLTIAFAVIGWILFVLIRALAGIRDAPRPRKTAV